VWRDQALEVVVGQAPVDAVIERRGRSIKISPDQGAPYAADECALSAAEERVYAGRIKAFRRIELAVAAS
jgi:hypothetical protein